MSDHSEDERMSEASRNEENDEYEEEPGVDSFANSIANILKQETKGKVPVLSGRKTKLMKESEKEKQEQRELHEKRVERKKLLKRKREEEFRESFSERNIDLEKQLRRLATRGVVALFNAVAKAKREAMGMNDSGEKRPSRDVPDDVSELSYSSALKHATAVSNSSNKFSANDTVHKSTKPNNASTWDVLGDAVATGWDQANDSDED